MLQALSTLHHLQKLFNVQTNDLHRETNDSPFNIHLHKVGRAHAIFDL